MAAKPLVMYLNVQKDSGAVIIYTHSNIKNFSSVYIAYSNAPLCSGYIMLGVWFIIAAMPTILPQYVH